MHIQIHDEITLQQIKDIFSSHYPYLKLEFYKKPHQIFEPSDEKTLLPCEKKLKELNTCYTGQINIFPTEKVADLEQEFQTRFGLPTQVLCLEHGFWTQTTGMDIFTLREANEFSKNDSDEFLLNDYEEGFEEVSEFS